ncbi:exodeoxyribonuclease VII small subunit [Marinobacterium aestuarii]|uniref:Exodeoxyribonuclease 7 small subunit n=2 Tax=Marinobacterium TaxID=48075 RepID=A0A1A9EUG3_9GAMM|nr:MULTISPECIES: exodeoxyribonuclease VII small subunit [Marinobacterium]ANG61380.1 exodeoxyribonuclease VII small subunit [Marinobacterium aestuarii]UTW10449.1 exodeoxyribonuclease VII small subunit [Marinobacterium rhizophilum]
MPRTKKTPDFETSLTELEQLVNRMEQGDMPLADALQAFEQGIALTRDCQGILDQAEQKVRMLVEKDGELQTVPFTDPEDA